MIKFSKFCLESLHHDTDRHCCAKYVEIVRREICAIVHYLPDKQRTKFWLPFKLSLLHRSRPKTAMASPQRLAHNVPNFVQIGSLSAKL